MITTIMMRMALILIAISLTIAISGCAFDLANVSFISARLNPSGQVSKQFELTDNVDISGAPCGYERLLKKGTNWHIVGSLEQGDVYSSGDQVLTVECSNIHEAYIVVSGRTLTGFYLPVEKGFVSISNGLELPIKQ